jgi:hypothetical protein
VKFGTPTKFLPAVSPALTATPSAALITPRPVERSAAPANQEREVDAFGVTGRETVSAFLLTVPSGTPAPACQERNIRSRDVTSMVFLIWA